MTAIAEVLQRGIGSAKQISIVQFGGTVVQALTNTRAVVAFDTLTNYATRIHQGILVDIDATNHYLATCQDPGLYLVRCRVSGTYATAAHVVSLELQKNAAAIANPPVDAQTVSDNDAYASLEVTAVIPLVAGDTVRPMLLSSNAGPTGFTITFAQMWIEKIG